jgi:DNA-binding NtrC family response regulator
MAAGRVRTRFGNVEITATLRFVSKEEVMQEYKILVVDDEEDFLESLSERLELRDVKPAIASSGDEALAKMAEEEPEVMVLDLKMPGMDGIEVLKKVKKAYPTTQVVILTGHGTEEARKKAEKIGAFAYLEKPVEMDTLMATLNLARTRFQKVKYSVDTAFMGAAMSMAGEVDMARKVMQEEKDEE